jgi:HEPN superfamily AbiU2-like protein
VLAIARLVGPPNSVGKSNLTIQRFPLLLTDQSLRDEISLLIERAKTSAAFAVDWRNRRLAHRDLDLALGKSPQPLDPATREKVEDSLSALRAVLQNIEWNYCVAHTAYYSPTPGDAEALLHVIRGGLLRESEKRERWNRGEFRDEETKPPEAI